MYKTVLVVCVANQKVWTMRIVMRVRVSTTVLVVCDANQKVGTILVVMRVRLIIKAKCSFY